MSPKQIEQINPKKKWLNVDAAING